MIRFTALALCTGVVALVSTSNVKAIDLGFGLFKKKTPPNEPAKVEPSAKAKQLIATLQTDTDSNHRKTAAETLRTIDPRTSPEIITALVGSLQTDPVPAVRSTAAQSIGAIKSVYPSAGAVLESVEKNDPDANVRAAAKSALWNYHMNGYRTAAATGKLNTQSPEPPLAAKVTPVPLKPAPSTSPAAMSAAASDVQFRPISQGVGKGNYYQPTNEPPLALPKGTAPSVTPPVIPVPEVQKPFNPDPVVQPIPIVPGIPSGEPTIVPPPSR